jgi:hypothetical protein
MKTGDLIKVESKTGELRPPWYGMMGIIIGLEPDRDLIDDTPLWEVVVTDPSCPMKGKPLLIRESYLCVLSNGKSPRLQKNNTVTESNEVK